MSTRIFCPRMFIRSSALSGICNSLRKAAFAFFQICFFPLLCSAAVYASDHIKVPQPRIVFQERLYDFGVSGPDEQIRHTFRFTNNGTGTLHVDGVTTDCGCTAALVSASEIPPGGTGEIKAVFKTNRLGGKQEKVITVYSDDPYEPEIDLVIRGIIKREVAVVPQGLNFDTMRKGETLTKTVRLLQLSKTSLVINQIDINNDYFDVATSRFREENSRGIKVAVTLKTDNVPAGQLKEVITLHTNLKRHPRIDVPIWATIMGEIKIEPRAISFGLVKKETGGSAVAVIARRDGGQLRILKTESSLPYLAVEVEETVPGEKYKLTVHVRKNSPAGRMEGEIRIFTDYPGEAVVTLPCFALIRK